ncbi:hypothetical protein [Nostoc sp.]|uniref:hypothetical protein n=1 Tax=Nostoc sp. TaxID=1180 RepID=UPI002FF52BB9
MKGLVLQTTFRECVFTAIFGGITSVAFSADGRHLAISDSNGGIITKIGYGRLV